MFRKAVLVLLPAATLLSPMLFFRAPQWWSQMTASFSAAPSGAAHQQVAAASGKSSGKEKSPAAAPAAPETIPFYDLTEVLRFDVTPGWVVARWPRVSAGLAQLQLQGYRVPLVTGTAEDDVAGSLTYYFNPSQQVQRLTFHGTTGKAGKLVHVLSTRYGFRRRLTNDPGVFLYESVSRHGKATSFLWIRPAPVVKASEPMERFEVALLMERPETT